MSKKVRAQNEHEIQPENTICAFSLVDLLFAIVCFGTGMVVGRLLSSHLPGYFRPVAGPLGALCVYLALMYPFYRGLKLFPIITPRCPCCGRFQDGYHIVGDNWPRIGLRCPTCDGEFVIWYNGKPSAQETWEQPVLVLKWPYAFGIYKRAKKPEPGVAPNAGSADDPPASAS